MRGRIAQFLLWLVVLCSRLWVWPLTRLYSLFRTRRRLPPIRSPILALSATQLAADIRTRKVGCVEVIQAYAQRINEVRKPLNCVVEDRLKEALLEAARVDEMLKETPDAEHWARTKPLLGVPLTVKESIQVKGMSHTSGRIYKKPIKADEDAPCIAKLREAGAIPLLVSTTPEFCMSYETISNAYGVTNNPYDTRRTCGGSSGGEGALLGSAASVIGLGSDIAGSSRLPALFCGVYGHKPTPGLISTAGHKPTCKDPDYPKVFTMAPMCRYAEDLPLVLRNVIEDPEKEALLKLDQPVDLSKLKIYYMESDGTIISNKVHKEIKRGLRRSMHHFKTKFGIEPQKLDLPLHGLWAAAIILMTRMKGIESIFSISNSEPDEWKSVSKEFMKFFMGCSDHTFPSLLYGPLRNYGVSKSDKTYQLYMQYKKKLMDTITETLGDNGVLFLPMFYDLANFHYQFYYKLLNTNYCSLCNLLELPSTACPIGLATDGRPLGIQLVVCKNQDRLSFAVAKELEETFGGWTPPPQEKEERTVETV